MAQWSQGLPLGSTEHFFSFSKNSTSSETVASSIPNLSSLGCSGNCELPIANCEYCSDLDGAPKAAEKGASHGDCATCRDIARDSKMSMFASGFTTIEGVRAGGADDTKLMMRARGGSGRVRSAPFCAIGALCS